VGLTPVLTLILCSRNDEYMGNSRWRLETSLDFAAHHAAALGLLSQVEIVVADWGSETPLRDAVQLTPAAAQITSFVHVSPALARTLQGDSPFPEVIALNAAARRSRGHYIGRIDQDTMAGGRFFSTFFDIVSDRLDIGLPPEETLFFSRRRRIPYRLATQCPPRAVMDRFLRGWSRWLRVESGPSWAPFYVSSVGIWLVHRSIWEACGGYDEEMIYMGAMEGNMIARLMTRHRMVDLGPLVDHDFFHLEHYHPWVDRHPYTFRKGNDERYRMAERVKEFAPNGADWGMAAFQLDQILARPAAPAAAAASHEHPGWSCWWLVVRTAVFVAVEGAAVKAWRAPRRLAERSAVWRHRAAVALATIARRPVGQWAAALRERWQHRDRGPLVFPTNIHDVQADRQASRDGR